MKSSKQEVKQIIMSEYGVLEAENNPAITTVTEWANYEGIDVHLEHTDTMFTLSYEDLDAINSAIALLRIK